MKHLSIFSFLLVCFYSCAPQSNLNSDTQKNGNSPKIVVGIVVDQMRYDYLYKYWNDYGELGIKRLINKGYSCENHHYSYAPTYTGPGHASIYTGTTPAVHGIISNDWFDKKLGKMVYCAGDDSCKTVGSQSSQGAMSAHRMISNSICDELKLNSNLRSKTYGVSIKDRGAILPAGHLADGAFWFQGDSLGSWISSDRYYESLPEWIDHEKNQKKHDAYLKEGWSLLKDPSVYDESGEDHVPYESPFKGKLQSAMPYDLSVLAPENGNYSILKNTPWGNTLTTDMAMELIKNENLGDDEYTDFLALSYSATDYIGHKFGPQSLEVQDTYLRLDLEFERLINYLDEEFGSENYLIFLTADHGVVEIPALTNDLNMPTGKIRPSDIEDAVNANLLSSFGPDTLLRSFSNGQFFLDKELIKKKKFDIKAIKDMVIETCLDNEGILMAFPSEILVESQFTDAIMSRMQKGYNQSRSGDVLLVPKPGWLMTSYPTGTSHGSPFAYDTHVPLIFYGGMIDSGSTFELTEVEDIAPTLAALLKIQMPNGCTGNPITKVLE